MLILNTPWNPVGTVLTRQELTVITEFCERRNLVLLSDEIYEAITYGSCRHVSPLAVGPGLRDRAILINSFSKSRDRGSSSRLAGMRRWDAARICAASGTGSHATIGYFR